MKRKQVMAFLLAVAMVAGNVATGTPEIVKAEATENSFADGLYVEVTKEDHVHTKDCYQAEKKAAEAKIGMYVKAKDGSFIQAKLGTIVKPVETGVEYNLGADQEVTVRRVEKPGEEDQYIPVVVQRVKVTDDNAITEAYNQKENKTLNISAVEKAAVKSLGGVTIGAEEYVYQITAYQKIQNVAEADEAAIAAVTGTPFCVTVDDETKGAYELGDAGTYIASEVRTTLNTDDTEIHTDDDHEYIYGSVESGNHWYTLQDVDPQPSAPYVYDEDSHNFVAKYYEEVTESDVDSSKDHTATYKLSNGTVVDAGKVVPGKFDSQKYYTKVANGKYVKTVVAGTDDKQDLLQNPNYSLTASYWNGGDPSTIESSYVKVDYNDSKDYDGGEKSTVKVTKIDSGLIAVLDDGDGILEEGEKKALSDLTAEDLQKLNITFPVYKLTDPGYSLGKAPYTVNNDKPGFEAKADAMTVNVTNENWTYEYKIDSNSAAALPEGGKIDLSGVEAGVHTFTLIATNKNVGTVKKEMPKQIYVICDDGGSFDKTTSFEYTRNPIAFKYTPSRGQTVEYSYRKHVESDAENHDGFTQSGLPTDAGTYDIKAVVAENLINGYKETTKYQEQVKITAGTASEDKGTTTIVKNGTAVKLNFTDEISKYLATDELMPGEVTFTSTAGEQTKLNSLTTVNHELALQTNAKEVSAATEETLTGTVSLNNVTLTLTATVSIQPEGTVVKTVAVTDVTTEYDEDATSDTIKNAVLDAIKVGGETVSEDKLTIKYNESGDAPTDAGTYNINVSFSSGSAIGTGTGKLTINPKEITVKAEGVEYIIGESGAPSYSAKLFDGEKDVTADKATYVSGEITATCPSANLTHPGTYAIIPSATATKNYELKLVNGTLTVKAKEYDIEIGSNNSSWGTATPSKKKAAAGEVVTISVSAASGYHLDKWQANDYCNVVVENFKFTMPARTVSITAIFAKDSTNSGNNQSGNNQPSGGGSPITSGDSTPTTDKPADTKPADKPADKPVDTTTAKVETNAAGETVITNAAGEAIKNDIVKVDGAKYITDESGVVIKDSFATTPSGNKVFADESGKVITDKTFKVDGVKYVASKSGAIVTDSFATTESGNKVFCDETGAVVTNTTVVVDGEKYFAKASGAIATKQFVKTPSGNKVYCSKDGSIITNKAFKVGGKQYVATKSGKIVTGKWVTIGSKKYYCNKNGVVTKTKKVTKK